MFVTIRTPSFLSYLVGFFTGSKVHFLWCTVLSISTNAQNIAVNHSPIQIISSPPSSPCCSLIDNPPPALGPSGTHLFSSLWFSLPRLSCESNQTILDLVSFTSQNAPMLFGVWWHLSQASTLHSLSFCRHYPSLGSGPVFVMQLQFSSWWKENLVNLKLI